MDGLFVTIFAVDDLHAAIEGLLSTVLRALGVLKSGAWTQPVQF